MSSRKHDSAPKPPRFLLRFFKWFCRTDLHRYIEGDLLELYQERVDKMGKRKAGLRFTLDVLLLFRPGIIGGIFSKESMRYGIIRNYFVTTFRSAKREKTFAILNVFCLAIGFTACLYTSLYVAEELSYDTFHEKAKRIYRINQTYIWHETDKLFGSTGPGVMNAVQREVPEFESMTRIHPFENTLVANVSENSITVFEEEKILSADSNFFDVFTFPLLKGNPKTALVSPNSIVLTEKNAYKYFGHSDILGKQLVIGEANNEEVYRITGVAADIPANSHIDFNFLISMSSIKRLKRDADTWWWTTFVTFGVLNPEADIALVEKKVAAVPEKYLDALLKKYQGISYEAFIAAGKEWNLYVQPFLDIHLHSTNVFSRLNKTGDIKSLYTLGFISALILLLSVINFINLSTARSSKRAKEVGVRKVLGSYRSDLVIQFLLESLLFCFTALVISGILVGLFLPILNSISGKEISFWSILESNLLVSIGLVTLIVGVLAGFYPAFYLSTFKPKQVLKGNFFHKKGLGIMRNALVTLQFSISIALIVCALIINEQVQHWLTMDLGFNRENKLIIQHVERLDSSLDAFRNKIAAYPQVEHVTYSSGTPPYVGAYDGSFYLKGNTELQREVSYWFVDEYFMNTYDFRLIAGRNFNDKTNNTNGVLVSRSFTKAYGLESPEEAINRQLVYYDVEVNIIGVFEDFNSELDWIQLPIAFFYKDRFDAPSPARELTIGFKNQLSGTEITNLLASIEQEWQIVNPNAPFDYSFLNQAYEMVYEPTIKFGKLMKLYAVLAILIAGLGLIGLVAYVIEKRKKEIGIRKVLGASVSNIILSLTNGFFRLLALGFIIASVISWYIMQSWVENFTYQVPIGIKTFILSGLGMLCIIVFTLSFQTIKAALSNPIDSLKSE